MPLSGHCCNEWMTSSPSACDLANHVVWQTRQCRVIYWIVWCGWRQAVWEVTMTNCVSRAYMSVCLCVCLCLSVSQPACLPVTMSVSLCVSLSVTMSVCVCVCVSRWRQVVSAWPVPICHTLMNCRSRWLRAPSLVRAESCPDTRYCLSLTLTLALTLTVA